MRLIYAGTPRFAVPALDALIAAGHEIALVLTRPDRPAGRGLSLSASPVKQRAQRYGIPVFQPDSLRDEAALARLREVCPELMVVVAYGLILPAVVLAIPRCGALNVHASLLPRWRGPAPIQRALLAGDRQTGVCIMQMDVGLDTGPVVLHEAIPITEQETAGTLHDKLATLGAQLIVAALADLQRQAWAAVPQLAEGVTYARRLEKAEASIDWSRSATQIERQVRAFNPSPGATTRLRDREIKIWRASVSPHEAGATAGTITALADSSVCVACGEGTLQLLELQRAGGKRLEAANFVRGFPLSVGDWFQTAGH